MLFLLDASMSMRNEWKGGTKWAVATAGLAAIADSIATLPNVEMGLRVFGHLSQEPDKNCKDTRLEVPIDSNNLKKIKKKLEEEPDHPWFLLTERSLGYRLMKLVAN